MGKLPREFFELDEHVINRIDTMEQVICLAETFTVNNIQCVSLDSPSFASLS